METDEPPEVTYLCHLSPSHLGWGPAGSLWIGSSPGVVQLPGWVTWMVYSIPLLDAGAFGGRRICGEAGSWWDS